jgi:hypothetical protein
MNVRGLKHYYLPPETLYRFFVPLKLNLKTQAVKIFKGEEDTSHQVWGTHRGVKGVCLECSAQWTRPVILMKTVKGEKFHDTVPLT